MNSKRRQWTIDNRAFATLSIIHFLFSPFAFSASERLSGSDHGLYEQSIKSTKKSIDREMIDVLYQEAVDAYRQDRYDEALGLLDKIYSLDPQYEDVSKLRTSIRRSQTQKETAAIMDQVKDLMRKGDAASAKGQNIAAVNFWKEALALNPSYDPAEKKIQAVNQALARKEFEAGYIHYRHGELEDAQEAWSNALSLDPTYKQRGLLLLMSKTQRQVERDRTNRLSTQGFNQYQQGNLEGALVSYQELSQLEPRNEEARRMSSKIKIQLGQTALKAAQAAMAAKNYPQAIENADEAVKYGYETSRAQAIKTDAQKAIQVASLPKPPPAKVKKPTPAAPTPETDKPSPDTTLADKTRNPEEALAHYRKGLAAMRAKDYHQALKELDMASQLDSSNERIYIARQRAQQEWSAATDGPASQ